ncbi:FAD-dependent monooxygenase [Catenuloplanes japonicus]|uniref:FAD-dependent monooxygenase n=1 Tax=Catenuloplanes japonicus TaxID=33876 RepID=UPI0005272BD2|nr:FAD-dependent monooxygenase [Catenuloplanes japonicus]
MGKRALVVGLGIAGMSAAIGLRRAGWTPVIVERAAARRTGGYFIGVLPLGRQAADDLGIDIHVRNPEGRAWAIDRRGERAPGLGFLDQPGRPAAVVRGDIEAALWERLDAEVRFATTPVAFAETGAGVEVTLAGPATRTETFDLVVGADGMRSTVRQLVFGPHERFLTNWDAMICAFPLERQVPGFGPEDSVTSARAGRAAWVFGFTDRPPTALLTYRTKHRIFPADHAAHLRDVFAGMDDVAVRHVLDSLESAPDHLFDSVHQVRMRRWSSGRVLLLGDAAWCLNLYSGMGATAGLYGGVELGRALGEHPGDLGASLAAWEGRLRPLITRHQRVTRLKQQLFVPSGVVAEGVRSALLRTAGRSRRRRALAAVS